MPSRSLGFAKGHSIAVSVLDALKAIVVEKDPEATSNHEGAFLPLGGVANDPKAKAPGGPADAIPPCLEAISQAIEKAGVSVNEVSIAVGANGSHVCRVSQEEVPPPEDAEEGTEPTQKTIYTYSYGEPKETESCIEMFLGLLDQNVTVLVDPFHVEDPGLSDLAINLTLTLTLTLIGGPWSIRPSHQAQ